MIAALCSTILLAAPAPQDPAPPPDAFRALEAGYDASELDRGERYQAFRTRFLELAETAAEDEVALNARLWLYRNAWNERQAGTMGATAKAHFEVLLDRFGDSPRLTEVIDSGFVLASGDRIPAYRRLMARTPHDTVRAEALLGIGSAASRSRDPETRKQAEPALKRLAKEYAGLPYKASTFGAMADAYLNLHPREALAIGQVAPEISGADLDGEPMKLSDYRGKVVVLDFWGHW